MWKDNQFVFIIGAPRSGSTWLHDILASHPEVASTNAELTVFSGYVGPMVQTYDVEYRNKQKGIEKGLVHLWSREKFDTHIRNFISEIYSSIEMLPQHKIIIDKHPIYSFWIKDINYYLPQAKFINIIRDGRDMAHSWNRMSRQRGWGNPLFSGACLDWIRFNNGAKTAQRLFKENYLEVYYENLLSNTKDELERIFSFCSINASPDIIDSIFLKHTGEKSLVSAPDKKFSFSDRKSGKASWKTRLTKEEQYIAKKYLANELIKYGYEKDYSWGPNGLESVWYAFMLKLKTLKRFTKSVVKRGVPLFKKAQAIINNTQCSVCGAKFITYLPLNPYYKEQFMKYGFKFFGKGETVNEKKYYCPICASSDRERLYALYFSKLFNQIDKSKTYNLLDIAPTISVGNFLRKYPFIKRRTADLMMEGVDDKVDITDMKIYDDETFDSFICSHVLEHVSDADKAMRELFRILKKGGKGIAMVPIAIGVDETLEDPNHKTIEERWKHYGQDDHLRLFGKKDFVRRLGAAGFKVHQLGIDYFGRRSFKANGILEWSILYVVEK